MNVQKGDCEVAHLHKLIKTEYIKPHNTDACVKRLERFHCQKKRLKRFSVDSLRFVISYHQLLIFLTNLTLHKWEGIRHSPPLLFTFADMAEKMAAVLQVGGLASLPLSVLKV